MQGVAAAGASQPGADWQTLLRAWAGAGNQPFPQPKEQLRYGQSITDACIGWADTEALVREIHATLAPRFA